MKHYIVHYIDENNNKKQMNFDNKEFLKYWFEEYIHTNIYKFIEKIELEF